MLDITGSEAVEVTVREDGTVLWVNTAEDDCVLRICRIQSVNVEDNRSPGAKHYIQALVDELDRAGLLDEHCYTFGDGLTWWATGFDPV